MKNAYSFLRWSTKGQNKENRDSRKRQTESAERWINEHSNGEYQLSDKIFIADGQSAFKGSHISKEKDAHGIAKGELRRFIQQVEDGTISKDSILLIDSVDRFSRLSPPQALTLFSEVLNTGIGLVFTGTHEKRVVNNELLAKEGHILYFIIGELIRSNTESAEKSRKIVSSQQSKKIKMQAGEILKHHNAPKYYSYNKDKKRYEKNLLTPIVEGIINSYLEGKSLYQISNKLNADKVRSIRYANKQANWSRMAIKSLLESKCLYGEFLGIADYFGEPVIDKPTWDKIQMMLVRNSGNKGRYSTDFVNIFRGIGVCATCGRQMAIGVQVMNYKSGKPKAEPYRYMRCCSRSNGLPCTNNSQMNLADVENSFFTEFLSKNPADFINGDEKLELRKIEKEVIAKQTNLNKITEKVDGLGAMIGVFPTAKLLKDVQALKIESAQLQSDIDALNRQKTSIMAAPISRDIFCKTIDFNTGEEKATYLPFSDTEIINNLKDNAVRIKLRNYLPNEISKVVFDTTAKTYAVYNRSGMKKFESEPVDTETNWKKIVKLSWRKKHRDAMKGMNPAQIQDYVKQLAKKKK